MKTLSTMLSNRYFTRDCAACPFWDSGYCTMVANCSTFQDLFSGGTFYSAITVARTVYMSQPIPAMYNGGYYIDCDGFQIAPVEGDGADVARELADKNVVGILVPASDK